MNDQPAPRPAKVIPKLEDYPFRVREIVRFGDIDAQGHVNQAVYSTYFESGRVAMFRDKSLGIGVPNATFVMVRMEVNFMRVDAAIFTGAPVCGLRPVRALLFEVLNEPKPGHATLSPFFAALVTVSKKAPMVFSASVLVTPAALATASISSALVIPDTSGYRYSRVVLTL